MKFQTLLIAGLLLIPCFAARAENEVVVNEPAVAEGCECLVMPAPMLEKVSSQCSVEEKAPAHCFKVEKIQKTTDLYKIAPHTRRCCTITDENGTRPCGCGEGLCCPSCEKCPKKCAPKCCPRPSCRPRCCR